jgi:hypothetical protein
MNRFTFNIYIPSLDKYIRFKELSNQQYLTILKFIQNNDNEGLQDCFNTLISKLIYNKKYIPNLNRIDIFCILLTIRAICVGSNIELSIKSTGKRQSSKLNIANITAKVVNGSANINHNNTITINEDISVSIGLPSNLYYGNDDTFFSDCIKTITHKSACINYTALTYDQKQNLLGTLPSMLFSKILHLINKINLNVEPITVIDTSNVVDAEQTTDEESKVIIRMFDNSLFEVTKFIYRQDLMSMYDKQYILHSKIHLPSDQYNTMTPAEVDVYFNNYRHEINEERKRNSQQNPTMPPPGHMN